MENLPAERSRNCRGRHQGRRLEWRWETGNHRGGSTDAQPEDLLERVLTQVGHKAGVLIKKRPIEAMPRQVD